MGWKLRKLFDQYAIQLLTAIRSSLKGIKRLELGAMSGLEVRALKKRAIALPLTLDVTDCSRTDYRPINTVSGRVPIVDDNALADQIVQQMRAMQKPIVDVTEVD